MIRAVLIGVTGYGAFYLSQLLRLVDENRVQLLGAVIRNPDLAKSQIELVQSSGARVFSTTDEMFAALNAGIDLCCIPTELSSHASLTIQALEHGCNVLVEKPAAVTVQDIDAMRSAARKAGRKVMVGFQNIYNDDIQYIKRELLNGSVGQVQTIKMLGLWRRDAAYFNRNAWAGKLRVGRDWVLDSPANNAFAHFINILCFLAGPKFEESSELSSMQAELYRAMSIESFDTAFVKAVTASGILLHFSVTHACAEMVDPQIQITGSTGEISWSLKGKESVNESRVVMFDKVIDHLNGSDDLVCDLDIAYSLTQVINAMHVAASITQIAEQNYSVIPSDSGDQIAINNIEGIVEECYQEIRLPGELNIPWARSTEMMDCSDFDFFAGPKP